MVGEKAHHERCEGHGHAHPPHFDLAVMIDRARAFAAARKLPFTEMRARVLSVLAREEKPLTAYEIVDRLSVPKKVQAVQVYRALGSGLIDHNQNATVAAMQMAEKKA